MRVYQQAGHDLYTGGSPYLAGGDHSEESQYRYPPLLAMTAPILTWWPLWYGLVILGAAWPFVLAIRGGGIRQVALPLAVVGPTIHGILTGNIQPLVNGAWAAVPFYARWGPVLLAAIVWIKVWPVVSVLYWAGRRDWRSIYRFTWALALIGLVQLPWLDDWVRYWLSPEAAYTRGGFALDVLFGQPAWLAATILSVAAVLLAARTRWGWPLTIVTYFAANPRWFLPSLSSVSAALPVTQAQELGPAETPPKA